MDILFFQTPEDWHVEVAETRAEKKKKKHRRSASFGHADKKLAVRVVFFLTEIDFLPAGSCCVCPCDQ